MSSRGQGKNLSDVLREGFRNVKEVAMQYSRQDGMKVDGIFLPENILLFVTEGQFTFRYAHVSCTVAKQQYIFFRKGMLLEYKTFYESATFFLVILKNEWVINVMKTVQWNLETSPATRHVIKGNTGMHLYRYFELLQLYTLGDGTVPQSLAGIKGMELLYCLSKNESNIIPQMLNESLDHKQDLTQIVENNIGDSIALKRLAQLAGRSISSFRRDFQSIYNMPPSRWIRQRKLEKAKELLTATNMTVTNICYTLGFESIAHFSRLFKSYFGYPPSGSRCKSLSLHAEKIQVEIL